MSKKIIAIRSDGRLANQMFQLMLAFELKQLVPEAQIMGFALPEWGLASQPLKPRTIQGNALLLPRHRFDFHQAAKALAEGLVNSIVIEGWGMRLEYFGSPSRYQQLFQTNTDFQPLSDKQLLINIRGEDILTGWHPSYYPLAYPFYEQIIDSTGLEPVFMGQIGPDNYSLALKKRFRGARFLRQGSAISDFQTIRHSKHVVLGISSFSWLASWLSETAINIHLPVAGLFDPRSGETDMLPVTDSRYHFYAVDFPDMQQRQSLDLETWANSADSNRLLAVDEINRMHQLTPGE
ncbi:hypothetical protein BOW35_10655 [Solemya velum gill symbiont]|uniref:hypothetical protein n=1 Tax=Solemya velum gill symbiont TaxID=2340 RepID=UPI000997EB43|nr:hypothetical protein [Solemya velum gill symbiont]OOZ13384.1 hypothetical protein BOW27_09655 [Solemya velum gill symbiont]OOZ17075.1 hypothetical protein BOW28_07705 [Solemya velum gill symbiont]OOZ18544.1 hypothetical protein BOW29_09570 [Solemya velum gill symbiont]OOZ21307.1 hypothetical protein BOW30_10170 [Solemya velum gill symbiont]OOZ22720.1 hypothetical protein BOW31_10785 [Solemya velum gill symbiont]